MDRRASQAANDNSHNRERNTAEDACADDHLQCSCPQEQWIHT
jgi:hypothetical protein